MIVRLRAIVRSGEAPYRSSHSLSYLYEVQWNLKSSARRLSLTAFSNLNKLILFENNFQTSINFSFSRAGINVLIYWFRVTACDIDRSRIFFVSSAFSSNSLIKNRLKILRFAINTQRARTKGDTSFSEDFLLTRRNAVDISAIFI